MPSCSDHPTECVKAYSASTCNPSHVITMDDVHKFFALSIPCTTTIAYLDMKNKVRKTEVIRARKVDEDCYLHFAKHKKYYYVYDSILQWLMAWIKDPEDITFQAIVGNHMTIGYDDTSGWDIHERLYDECKQKDGSLLLSKKPSKQVRYKVVNNLLVKEKRGGSFVLATAKHVWNDICCWLEGQEANEDKETHGGNRKLIRRPFRPISYYKNVADGLRSHALQMHLDSFRDHGKTPDNTGILRIPYLKTEKDADMFCEWVYNQAPGMHPRGLRSSQTTTSCALRSS